MRRVKGETEQLKNQLARALADYDNLKKRIEREKEEFEKSANIKLAIRLLPVLDVLKQAQKHLNDPGIAMTVAQFEDALKSEGIEEIKIKQGDSFDPEIHEAIETVANGKDRGKIVGVASSGWRFSQGPVIRHAQVRVTKGE